MKTIWLLSSLLLVFFSFSCGGKIEKRGSFVYKTKIRYKHHEDAKTEFTYHWGYSIIKGEFCWHWGIEDIPEENLVSYFFFEDSITEDNKDLFKADSIIIHYTKVFRIKEGDTLFLLNKIEKIVKL